MLFSLPFRHKVVVAVVSALTLGTWQARAACYAPQQQLPAQTVNDFLANPAQLLAQYPNGGPQLISRIRDLAASDPGSPPGSDQAVLKAILTLALSATGDQKTAIGTGLGQAARICVKVDQGYANAIQAGAATDAVVRTAYTAVTGDVAIGGTGGGGASGGGGGGQSNPLGFTGGSNSGGSAAGSSGTASASQNFFTGGVSGGGSVSITNTTIGPTPSGPVSQ